MIEWSLRQTCAKCKSNSLIFIKRLRIRISMTSTLNLRSAGNSHTNLEKREGGNRQRIAYMWTWSKKSKKGWAVSYFVTCLPTQWGPHPRGSCKLLNTIRWQSLYLNASSVSLGMGLRPSKSPFTAWTTTKNQRFKQRSVNVGPCAVIFKLGSIIQSRIALNITALLPYGQL